MIKITTKPINLTQSELNKYRDEYNRTYSFYSGTPPAFEDWVQDKMSNECAPPSPVNASQQLMSADYAVYEKRIADLEAENKALHLKLAGASLRASQGWSRYESANKRAINAEQRELSTKASLSRLLNAFDSALHEHLSTDLPFDHTPLPWSISEADGKKGRELIGSNGSTVARLTALDMANAEVIARATAYFHKHKSAVDLTKPFLKNVKPNYEEPLTVPASLIRTN